VHRSGRDSVDHPSHGSDDLANVLCGCLYIAVHASRRPGMRIGFGGPSYVGYGDGVIHWEDAGARDHSRVRHERISELEDLKRRGQA
jgi:hypothetical protein